MRDITKSNFEKAERELKKQAEELANKIEPISAPIEIQEIKADLGSFGLVVNEGSDLISVTHPALHDSVVGIVHAREYANGNREAILKSMLLDRFSSFTNTHALVFTGSFSEPVATKASKEEIIIVPVEKKASQEKPIEPAKEITSDLPLLRSADSFRQNVETVAFRNEDKLNRFVASATNGLVDHLKGLRYDLPKVNEVDASALTENDGSFNGHIVASVSLENSTGPKYLNLPITISASKVVYPNEKEVKEFVGKGIDLRAKLEEKLALETLTAMAKVDAEEVWKTDEVQNIISERTCEITKEASDYTDGVSSTAPGSHIKLQKHLLPGELADWEVGSTIVADGKKWKLVSKGDGVDSNDKNEGSSSLWDFVECLPEEGDDKIKADIPR